MTDRQGPKLSAMGGVLAVIVGWLVAQTAFSSADVVDTFEFSTEVRNQAKVGGPLLIFVGALLAVWSGLRAPLVLLVAGVTMNLAAEAYLISPHGVGLVGILVTLVASLWASRQCRS